MRTITAILGGVLLLLAPLATPSGAVRAVPLDALTTINPQTAKALQGSNGSDWTRVNPVWDGRRILLTAARGERIALQIVLLVAPEDTLTDIRVRTDIDGVTHTGDWRTWHIWDAPAVAIPLPPDGPVFSIPSAIPAEREADRAGPVAAWSLWLELHTPADAAPGLHEGTVTVSAGAGMPETVFDAAVRVLPLQLPARPSFLLEMNSYGDYRRLLGAAADTFLDIHRLFRRFRCTFTQVPYLQSGEIPQPFLAPRVTGDAGDALDWSAFDDALGGLFSGETFADGEPLSHFLLPLNISWPAAPEVLASAPAEYARINVATRRAISRHIHERGWNRTAFLEFHNENPSHGSPAPWRLDEPLSASDMEGHALFTSFLPEDGPILYRIDISDWRRPGDALAPALERTDVWSVSENPAFLDAEAAALFREHAARNGGFTLAYGEMPGFVENGEPVPYGRACEPLFRAASLKLDGYAQWITDRWKSKEMDLPEAAVPFFYSSAGGRRDMMWPGSWLGVDGPLPGLRLFALRECLNLLDYAAAADADLPYGDLAAPADFYALKQSLGESVP